MRAFVTAYLRFSVEICKYHKRGSGGLLTGHVAMTTLDISRTNDECPNMDMPKYGGEVVTRHYVDVAYGDVAEVVC